MPLVEEAYGYAKKQRAEMWVKNSSFFFCALG